MPEYLLLADDEVELSGGILLIPDVRESAVAAATSYNTALVNARVIRVLDPDEDPPPAPTRYLPVVVEFDTDDLYQEEGSGARTLLSPILSEISDVDGLQAALDALQASAGAATDAELADAVADLEAAIDAGDDVDAAALAAALVTVNAALAGKANAAHTHAQADVTGLVAALAALQPLDADLTSIAALTTTAYGRALLELANAAAGRSVLGLGNVDNTADSTKPVSTAQQTALDLKADEAGAVRSVTAATAITAADDVLLADATGTPPPAGIEAAALGSGGSFTAGLYYWSVTAVGPAGESIAPPSGAAAQIATNGRCTITWDAVSGATGYKIYRSAFDYGNVTATDLRLVTTVGAVTTYTDTGTATTSPQPPATNGAAFTVTLPAAAGISKRLTVKAIGRTPNVVTLDGNGAELIDGAASIPLGVGASCAYQAVDIVANGSGWVVV